MTNYFENINTIAEACKVAGIPHSVNPLWEGFQIRFPWCEGDIACHASTYGNRDGFVESYQFPWDDGDVTMLRPEAAARKVIGYYKEVMGE